MANDAIPLPKIQIGSMLTVTPEEILTALFTARFLHLDLDGT